MIFGLFSSSENLPHHGKVRRLLVDDGAATVDPDRPTRCWSGERAASTKVRSASGWAELTLRPLQG